MRAKSIKSAYDKLQADMSAKLQYLFKEYYPQGFPMVTQSCGIPTSNTVMPFTGTEILTFHQQIDLLDQMETALGERHVVYFDRFDHWTYSEVVMLKFANYLIDKMREGLIDNYVCQPTSLRTPAQVLARFIKVYVGEYFSHIKPEYYPTHWLKDYFMGLPSSCSVEFANPKIAELAESWGVPAARADRFAECWFGSCRVLVEHLCDEYDVDVEKIYNEYRKNH